ncbi:PREDICTED: ribonuclease Z, mitochondrial isoform X1 [Diuraphis noxia]|uniref:ribonuclease Z, mitochondrial isoform X1 n=1 Tax=Diuraphis noxia TaxID=143948 RepID=UPI0007635A6B|nr:PREDICTED: ribonuclease Z, mitochondrial isoform X1 [Diuraphis noxia]
MSLKLYNKLLLKFIQTNCQLFYFSGKNTILKQMSKNVSLTTISGKQNRFKIKGKSKFPPGIVKFQVLGSGANGAPRCLYLFTDHSRYLFNCGEGTQRLAHEHKMKLSKLEHVFITHSNWLNIGGLPGLALTVQDVGVPNIELHGPKGIEELFVATKRFVVLRDLKITASKSDPFKPYEDNAIVVHYVPLISSKQCNEFRSRSENSIEINNSQAQQNIVDLLEDDTNYYDYENLPQSDEKDRNKRKRSNSEPRTDDKKFIADSSLSRISNVAMSYVCHLKPKPGFLDLDKCVQHNVPPGPLLGLLKSGKDITLSDGTVVKSSDVTSPDDPGPVFIVVECPSEDYIESLLNESIFSKHQLGVSNEEDIAFMVVHFTPQDVRNDQRYQSWMKLFPSETYHLLLNNENKCLGSTAIHRIQYKLNMLDENIYPLLKDDGIPIISQQEEIIDSNSRGNSLTINGQTNLSFNLRPNKYIDRTSTLSLDVNEFIEESFKVDGFKEKLAEVKQDILNASPTDTNIYPKITFLGTGSCIPSKTRNTSGILMYTGEKECVLLDSGEGTYGQLVRHFGITGAETVLRDLKAIYVSHLHADHHIGLIGILSVRQKMKASKLLELNQPIYLLAPVQIMTWLNFYHRRFAELNKEFQIVSNSDLDFESSTKLRINDLLKQTNMSNIETTLVRHCPNAFGVSFTHKNGWKVTYSGDTMPCDSLVKLGNNSNLLIHEATMEDQLVSEARRKMHSTMSQAINIGKKMNAKFTILTHFSQRYAKIPYMPNNDLPSNVGIAFDNMEIAPNVLHKLPLMYPALKMIFAEHFEEMEAKCFKLKLKEEKAKTHT